MVNGVSSVRTMIIPNLIRLNGGAAKISVPVRPYQSLYANFKHITTIPTKNDETGIPVFKLRILDNLIEKLVGKKVNRSDYIKLTAENIDTAIAIARDKFINMNSLKPFSADNIYFDKGLVLNLFA